MGDSLLAAMWRGAGRLVDIGGMGARRGARDTDEAAQRALADAWATVTGPLGQHLAEAVAAAPTTDHAAAPTTERAKARYRIAQALADSTGDATIAQVEEVIERQLVDDPGAIWGLYAILSFALMDSGGSGDPTIWALIADILTLLDQPEFAQEAAQRAHWARSGETDEERILHIEQFLRTDGSGRLREWGRGIRTATPDIGAAAPQ